MDAVCEHGADMWVETCEICGSQRERLQQIKDRIRIRWSRHGTLRYFRLFKPKRWKRPALFRRGNNEQCPSCERWFAVGKVMRDSQNTNYAEPSSNYFTGCRQCHALNDEHWRGMWDEYYNSRY